MKAMIFAAGLGTRLQPLTLSKPKALVEVAGIPMLRLVIEKLLHAGVTDVVINVHHFTRQITDYLISNNNFGINIHVSDETNQILDTGGGLKKAAGKLKGEKPVILYNTDILSDINLNKLIDYHHKNKAIATLAVRERKSSRYLLFDRENYLAGWKNAQTGKTIISNPETGICSAYAFSGIHIISPKIFSYITRKGKFSIIETYLELAKERLVKGYTDDSPLWIDMGKPENLKKAADILGKGGYPEFKTRSTT